jgi:two-component system, cell cycle sensor histidine kinase and response regulator CckA
MVDANNTAHSHEFAESVINTVREPLIVLDQNLRVVAASHSFYQFFKVKPEETVCQRIYDLGNKQWDIPRLRELLETILPQKATFDDYEVEHDFTTIGRRTMLLNARQIVRGLGKDRIILLAIEDITERKRLENELSESEERFRRLFETANDGILLLEKRKMEIRHANPAITAMLGYSHDECVGKEMRDIGILKEVGTCEEVLQALNDNGIINYKDIPVQTKAGQVVDTDIYMVDRAGLIQCNIRDITDSKQTENKLRKSENHLRTLVQTIPDLIWSKNKDGVYLSCNSMFERFFGAREEDIIGRTDYSFVDRALADSFVENDRRAMAAIKPTSNEEWVTFADDGHRVLLETIKTPMYNDEGTLLGVLGIGRDITARKQVEETLRVSEAKIQSILNNIGTGVALISPNMEVLELNQQMREWFPDIDVGQRSICYRVLNDPPFEVICENCPTSKALRDGLVHETIRQTHQKKGTRTYRLIASPIFNTSGEVTAAVEMVEDITEKLSLESQLIQAQKMESIGRLAGGVAHDFNNMLSVILGYGQMIVEMTQPDNPLHEYAQEICAAGVRSTNITRQLLAFARKQVITPKVLDLSAVVEDMLKMLRRLIGEDINLAWHPASAWPVKIDPSQLEQILANLCVNARDAIDGVGKITIETTTKTFVEAYCSEHPGFIPGDFTVLSISDDGCGMDKDVQSKIFEPFFTTKEPGKGTGLGLATVYGIVNQNNGFVNVYSEPGKGTTFRIYLSRHSEQENTPEKHIAATIPSGQGEIVLVVEDEASILKLTAKILNDFGYVVVTANSPKEAVNFVKGYREPIDLMVTDVIMPEMNGRDLENVLHTLQPNMKCLFMSGYPSTVIASQGVLAEGMQFIQKPFSANDLRAKVHEVLKSDKELRRASGPS